MSLRVSRNLGPHSSGAMSIFTLKEWLCTGHPGTKHWAIVASGDGGSAYSGTGDVITSGGSGANGMDNSNAWFVMRDADSTRWFLFHRSTAHYTWNLFYQLVAFDLTGCDATTPPSSGNNPNRKSWMLARAAGPSTIFPSSGSWYYHICCEGDSPDGDVYPFWAIGRLSGSGNSACLLLHDCVVDSLSPAADSDKAMLLSVGQTDLRWDSGPYLGYSGPSYGYLSGFMRYGELNEDWGAFAYAVYYDGGQGSAKYVPGDAGVNPEDSKYGIFPSFVVRMGGTTNGPKGVSNMVRWKPSDSMGFGDTAYDGTDYYLVADDLLLRGWPDSTGPSI